MLASNVKVTIDTMMALSPMESKFNHTRVRYVRFISLHSFRSRRLSRSASISETLLDNDSRGVGDVAPASKVPGGGSVANGGRVAAVVDLVGV